MHGLSFSLSVFVCLFVSVSFPLSLLLSLYLPVCLSVSLSHTHASRQIYIYEMRNNMIIFHPVLCIFLSTSYLIFYSIIFKTSLMTLQSRFLPCSPSCFFIISFFSIPLDSLYLSNFLVSLSSFISSFSLFFSLLIFSTFFYCRSPTSHSSYFRNAV